MNVEPEQRAALLGEYIAEHSATVRAAARAFGCSKSTVHKDVSTRLRAVDAALFARVPGRAGPQQGRASSAGRGGDQTQIQKVGERCREACAALLFICAGTAPARPFPAGRPAPG